MVVFDGMLQLILHRSANSFLTSVLQVSMGILGGSLATRTHSAHGGLSINGDHAIRRGTLVLHSALANLSFDADGMRCIELSESALHNQRNPGGASGGSGLGGAAELGGVSNSFSWMTELEFSDSDSGVASCEAGAIESSNGLSDGSNDGLGETAFTPLALDFSPLDAEFFTPSGLRGEILFTSLSHSAKPTMVYLLVHPVRVSTPAFSSIVIAPDDASLRSRI
jgi:hypothetical protein